MRTSRVGFGVAVSVLALAATAGTGRAEEGDPRVVVGFKGMADESLLARRGVAVLEVRGKVAVGTVSAAGIAALRTDADVAYVEEDAICEACGKPGGGGGSPPPESVPWGVTKVWGGSQPSRTGAGIKVAILDTGIDLDHPDLAANVAGNTSFVAKTSSGNDDNGHGSHVAGTVGAVDNTVGAIGVAPSVRLYAVKVLDRRGTGFLSDVAAGVDWCAANGMHVANLSLESASGSATLSTACANAETKGVLLVAAAGNSGDGNVATTETAYPAAYASVVSVGATDSKDALASTSNTNSDLEVSAPGVSVYSTYKDATYKTLSGTSMASPHAAGMAALLWEELAAAGSTNAAVVRAELQKRVRDLGATGRDSGFGYGVVYFPK